MFENKSMILFAVAWMLCAFLVFPAHSFENQRIVPSSGPGVISPGSSIPQEFSNLTFAEEQAGGRRDTTGVKGENDIPVVHSTVKMNFSTATAGFTPEISPASGPAPEPAKTDRSLTGEALTGTMIICCRGP